MPSRPRPRRSTPPTASSRRGLINTHHHLFQNLTRAYPPMTDKPLFGWLQSLYPLWRAHRRRRRCTPVAFVGLAELALERVHDLDRPPLPAPARRRRPAVGGDRRRPRPRHALPPDARVDVAEREGRRAAARRRGGRRRRDPRRHARQAVRPPPRPRRTGRWCGSRWRRAARSASPRS